VSATLVLPLVVDFLLVRGRRHVGGDIFHYFLKISRKKGIS
jgi:hypothetical protein